MRESWAVVGGRADRLAWRRDRAGVMMADGVARFRDPAAKGETPPFPAYVHAPSALGPISGGFTARPRFARAGRRALVRLDLPPGTSLYGLGERAGPLLRNGTRTTLWNFDRFDYDDKSPSLYQSHPFVLAVRRDGSALGLIVETTHRCVIDCGGTAVTAEVDGPPPAVAIIERRTPQEVVRVLAELTGFMPMPPRWALGYHQCRWSYEPEANVREIAAGFRERKIPCDVLWLDIDYMDGFRCFTFDETKFPDPASLIADLHEDGFRIVAMIDPGLKVDPAYSVYREARDGGHLVTDAAGGEYRGEVWPGDCAFPDFTRAATRRWWAGLYGPFLESGIDGVWNDMNEPAVFKTPGKSMPETNRHDADTGLGGPDSHARYHNIYGMQMARATRDGVERARPDKRPFILTRSTFLGGQRHAAMWTGDNRADWRHLAWSIPMALNLGLSGQPFAGPDIGGFVGESTPALFARWMGIGTLLPFARGHKIKEATAHEPWSLGEACERTCRLALERRSRLLPYLYTLFREAATTGVPVARPAFFADPADPRLRAIDDAFLLGADLWVGAAVTPDGRRSSPPPAGWSPFEPLEESDDDLPALSLRPGAILPLGPVMQWSDERPLDPLTLIVAPDAAGEASGRLYEDDGDGYGHRDGAYRLATYRAHRSDGKVRVELADREGSWAVAERDVEVVVLGAAGDLVGRGRDGAPIVADTPPTPRS